jgi:hypothetical protein
MVLVVGILAILMLMAATLALMSRVEMRASRYENTLDPLIDQVKLYCIEILEQDKWGMGNVPYTNVPYSYERLAAKYPSPGSPPALYPVRTAGDGLDGDDESFDSPVNEEWLPPPSGTGSQTWRALTDIPTTPRVRSDLNTYPRTQLLDTNGDGIIDSNDCDAIWHDAYQDREPNTPVRDMLPGLDAQWAIMFVDLGGRISINDNANILNAAGPAYHRQNQGLSPYEASIESVIYALNGGDAAKAASASRSIILRRYGADTLPGGTTNFLGPVGSLAVYDFNCDGDLSNDGSLRTDEPNKFCQDNPKSANFMGDDAPYGTAETYDFLIGRSASSEAASALAAAGPYSTPFGWLQYFTTRNSSTVLGSRSIRGTNVFTNTNIPTLVAYPFMNYYATLTPPANVPFQRWNSQGMLALQRPIQNAIAGGGLTLKDQQAWSVGQFIRALDPVFTIGSPALSLSDDQKWAIAYQIGVNTVDMVDAGSEVTKLNRDLDLDASPGTESHDFYGVEVTPYIAEVEAAIKTSCHPYWPDPAPTTAGWPKDRPGPPAQLTLYNDVDTSGTYNVGDEVWIDVNGDGQYDGGDIQLYDGGNAAWDTPLGTTGTQVGVEPITGWGKYIKLVNPWNVQITLNDATNPYRLRFPQKGKRWVFGDDDSNPGTPPVWYQQDALIGVDDGAGAGKIDLVGTAPARGHFVIIDSQKDQAAAPLDVFGNLPTAAWQQDAALAFLLPSQQIELQRYEGAPTNAWRTVMTTTYPQAGTEVDADDLATTDSVQIGDPRPCWVRGGVLQTEPWGAAAWTTLPTTAEWATSLWQWADDNTTHLCWFNRNWQGASSTRVGSGDGWFLLSGAADAEPNKTGADSDNLLASFPPAVGDPDADKAAWYSSVTGHQLVVMNAGKFASPGDLGFVHAGIEWGTVSLTVNPPAEKSPTKLVDVVYLRNFTDYLTGPVNPFCDGIDNDGDGTADSADRGSTSDDPEIRVFGKINVNTASPEVLRSVFKSAWFTAMWPGAGDRAGDLVNPATAGSIVYERNTNGPFSSVDDLFERVPAILGVDPNSTGANDVTFPNSFRREALARFMYDLVTVRTDTWGVVGIAKSAGQEKRFYFVLDRSYDGNRDKRVRFKGDIQ